MRGPRKNRPFSLDVIVRAKNRKLALAIFKIFMPDAIVLFCNKQSEKPLTLHVEPVTTR